MNVWPVFGLVDSAGGVVSDFLTSFDPGLTAVPKGLVKSGCGVAGGDFGAGGVVGPEPATGGGVFELEENFELILDIHEFLLPGSAALGSLGFLAAGGVCASSFSELERGR